MCGRYTLTKSGEELAEAFDLEGPLDVGMELEPRYNIAPTQPAPIVLESVSRTLRIAGWGLGGGRKGGGPLHINARAETVAERPAFRKSFAKRRCLVPADGFYEWRREEGVRQPYHFSSAERDLLAFAGIWEAEDWPPVEAGIAAIAASAGAVSAFAIITTAANELVSPVHDRMPVILPRRVWSAWLSPDSEARALQDLLVPFEAKRMASRRVSLAVNNARHEGPDCLAPPDDRGRQVSLLT